MKAYNKQWHEIDIVQTPKQTFRSLQEVWYKDAQIQCVIKKTRESVLIKLSEIVFKD